MKRVRITAVKAADYKDLQEKYENPITHACDVAVGQSWESDGFSRPVGFCESAWDSVSPFVRALGAGAEDFFDGWMKNKRSAVISCNDGFRPVSFLLETIE